MTSSSLTVSPASAKASDMACRYLTSSTLFPQQGEMWLCHFGLSSESERGAPCRQWRVPSCHTTRRLLMWFELSVFMLFNRIFIAMCHYLQVFTSTDGVQTYAGSWQGVHHGCLNMENLILHGLSKLRPSEWNSRNDLHVDKKVCSKVASNINMSYLVTVQSEATMIFLCYSCYHINWIWCPHRSCS